MSEIFYGAELKPEWEKFAMLVKELKLDDELEPNEQERLFGLIQGIGLVKRLNKVSNVHSEA